MMAAAMLYFRLFAWFSLRHMRRHATRTLAVLLGIALGASVFTSVRLAVHATVASFSRSMDRIAGSSDATLVQSGGRVPDSLVTMLIEDPAVRAVSPVLSTYVRPADQAAPFLLIGFDPILDHSLRTSRPEHRERQNGFAWATLMTKPYTLFIGEKLGRQFKWAPGSRVTLVHSSNTANFEILGILNPTGLALVEGGRIAICDIATFQEFTGLFGLADRIDVAFKPDVTPRAVAALKARLPAVNFRYAR